MLLTWNYRNLNHLLFSDFKLQLTFHFLLSFHILMKKSKRQDLNICTAPALSLLQWKIYFKIFCECQLLSISNITKLALKRFYLHFWRFHNFISRHLRVKFSIANKTGNFLWTWPLNICSFNLSWISLCDHLSSCTLLNVTRWNKNLSWPYMVFVSNFHAIYYCNSAS